MSNFVFLQNEWPNLFHEAREAERHTYTSPKASAILARSALEFTVRWLYANDSYLTTPYDTRLSALLHETCFKDILAPGMFYEVDAIRRIGNSAAHGNRINQHQALLTIKNLYRFLKFFCELYAQKEQVIAPFDETLLPDGKEAQKSKKQLQQLQEQLDKERAKQQREIELLQQQLEEQNAELLQHRQRIQERKTERKSKCPIEKIAPLVVSEQQTRQLYIDLLLQESGWDNLRAGYELEFEVSGMPKSTNRSGKGYVDYVLWGDNGKPLAVIEAKNAMQNVKKGRHQAELYATCLEKKYQQRPIILYTNGFETYMWDEAFYPEREVQGFYSKDELQLLIDRRHTRKDLRKFMPDSNIIDRHYQIEAVQRVAESLVQTHDGALRGKARQCLLVMATGSGKTRTAAAIVDMLTKCDWVKRVLFLADRNALVTQAKNAFNELLPHLSAIDLTREKEDNATRLVFSTYPTIMNKIDAVKSDNNRFYGVGHFDLIIIDEAHRSVYRKYGAIFDYFDSLLIGLTATPKTEIDRNTYQLFYIDDNNPTFAYELDEAVKGGYLVPYKAMSVPLKFQRDGIKYSELSDKEQQQYEETFGDPSSGEVPEEICGAALNKWLFNSDTVDKVLEHVMNHAIKIEGGDKLGKTIIFAKNHKHAAFIEERFNKHYPQYSGKFLRVIDNYESKAQDLLDKFVDKNADNDPQIAVSVDMMDTGVDAPRVVNLVFFKLVRSLSKFQQMIGRGTRLCPDLFAPGEDKTHFLIFDFCQNFEFFDENPEGIDGNSQKSLTQRIFEAKLEVATLIRNKDEKTTSENELAEKYINELHQAVAHLDKERFVVKKELRYVVEYKEKSQWQNLSREKVQQLHTHISHLMLPIANDHELARRFDLLILSLQIALLADSSKDKYIMRVYNTARQLQTKENIPAVRKHIELIKDIQQDAFWEQIHPAKLEQVRTALRELIQLIDREQQPIYYTNFQDEISGDIVVRENVATYSTLRPYHERVESYIRNHRNHIVIQKLNTNKPITTNEIAQLETILFDGEERGTKDDYVQHYGDKPLGEFIRSIIGLDVNVAKKVFTAFLQKGNLRADQMTFVNNIITYLTKNGMIDKGMLFEPPFTDINDQGLLGVFDEAEAHNIIKIIERVNSNAVAL